MVSFNDANEFFETAAAGGNAMRFKDIDGIGPKTANKITSIRGVTNPDDVKDMSADELSDKAGISYSRAEKAIRGAGGNPNVSKQNQSSLSNTSAAGISQPQGDFLVDFAELDKARAKNDARSRSEAAVRADERQRAPVTTDYEKWKDNKSRWDFPGVDTPTQEPNLLPKDVKAGNPNTADFQARDERIKERKEQSYPRKEKDGRVLQEKGNRILAADVAGGIPDGAVPGVAPSDFEEEPETPGQDPVEGYDPGPTFLPEPIRQNLAEGPQADMAFIEAEEERLESDGNDGMVFDFPEWTISRGQTYLNEKVYGGDREDLRPLREKLADTRPSEEIELERGEYQTFQQIVREGAQEEIERADRMEANIFGDTDEQAEIAQQALRGIINNPPR